MESTSTIHNYVEREREKPLKRRRWIMIFMCCISIKYHGQHISTPCDKFSPPNFYGKNGWKEERKISYGKKKSSNKQWKQSLLGVINSWKILKHKLTKKEASTFIFPWLKYCSNNGETCRIVIHNQDANWSKGITGLWRLAWCIHLHSHA